MRTFLISILIVLAYAAYTGWISKADAYENATIIDTGDETVIVYCEVDSDGTQYCWQ